MCTLLIIGGTGFFGKSILDSYKAGYMEPWGINRIIIMSRNEDQIIKKNSNINNGIEFFRGDIGTANWLPYADYVIHAAASSDANNYKTAIDKEKKNILSGVFNYCRLAQKFHKESKIVYVSSGAVYGIQPQKLNFIDESYLINAADQLPDEKTEYTLAKREAEIAFQKLARQGLNVSIARCFSFVGYWLPRDQHFAIGNFIRNGLSGASIQVLATKNVYRSYLYADEIAEWLLTIANASSPECPIYNVGSDEEISIRKLAEIIGKVFQVKIEAPIIVTDVVDRYIPSIEKAKKNLGLRVRHSLESAIFSTINKIMINK